MRTLIALAVGPPGPCPSDTSSWPDSQRRERSARRPGTRTTADVHPGTYTLTFDGGRFDIVHDQLGAFCTGSYHVTGDRVRLFAERREPQFGCLPGRFLEAGYTLTDRELRFDAATAHPVDAVLFAEQPLVRLAEG